MKDLKTIGKIKNILPIFKGISKNGKEWQKQNFIISNNDGYEGKEQIFCFELFGEEKVQGISNLKVGDFVSVRFNIKCNEYNNPTKGMQYFTNLSAWLVQLEGDVKNSEFAGGDEDDALEDLPF